MGLSGLETVWRDLLAYIAPLGLSLPPIPEQPSLAQGPHKRAAVLRCRILTATSYLGNFRSPYFPRPIPSVTWGDLVAAGSGGCLCLSCWVAQQGPGCQLERASLFVTFPLFSWLVATRVFKHGPDRWLGWTSSLTREAG